MNVYFIPWGPRPSDFETLGGMPNGVCVRSSAAVYFQESGKMVLPWKSDFSFGGLVLVLDAWMADKNDLGWPAPEGEIRDVVPPRPGFDFTRTDVNAQLHERFYLTEGQTRAEYLAVVQSIADTMANWHERSLYFYPKYCVPDGRRGVVLSASGNPSC